MSGKDVSPIFSFPPFFARKFSSRERNVLSDMISDIWVIDSFQKLAQLLA